MFKKFMNYRSRGYRLNRITVRFSPCSQDVFSSVGENSHVTDDVITLDVTCEDILWQMLPRCGLTVFYV